jgi:hypothetical protein
MSFRVNSPQVVSETIQGEVVMINLASGNYYSLKGFGADAWTLLEGGATAAEQADVLAAHYDAPPDAVREAAAQLLQELLAEELVVEAAPGTAGAGAVLLEEPGTGAKKPFEAVRLEKHTDMQDLILLDPVHEVDDRGWPYTQAAASA